MARGRKRKKGVPRTVTGRISQSRAIRAAVQGLERHRHRAETEAAAQATALAARARLHGIADGHLKDQRAGSVVGLMTLAGILDQQQYEAAMRYLVVRHQALKRIDAPGLPREPAAEGLRASIGCGCIGECRGLVAPHPCDRRTAQAASASLSAANAALWAAQGRVRAKVDPAPNEHRLEDAVSVIVIGDQTAPELETALRHALNALHEHFFVGRKQLVAS